MDRVGDIAVCWQSLNTDVTGRVNAAAEGGVQRNGREETAPEFSRDGGAVKNRRARDLLIFASLHHRVSKIAKKFPVC